MTWEGYLVLAWLAFVLVGLIVGNVLHGMADERNRRKQR